MSEDKKYYWLTANPKIWSFSELKNGDIIEYTAINENGNKRRIYKNYQDARKGDMVIAYEASPTKAIVGLCTVEEEMIARERNTAQHIVVESAFVDIGILSITSCEEHTIVPVYIGNSCTSLTISYMVEEFVVVAKTLSIGTTANTACDVELARSHILPDAFQCMEICGIARKSSIVSNSAIEITGTYGMTYYLLLLKYWHMILTILRRLMSVGTATSLLDEILSLIEILLFTRYFVKLCHSHLDDRMSTRTVYLILTIAEDLTNQVCILDGNIEQRTLAENLAVAIAFTSFFFL